MADIAIIDIAALFNGDRDARRATDDCIRRAVFETGGFVISNYPGADRVDARAATMLAFFDLPDAVKRAVATRPTNPENPRVYRGYLASLAPGSWAHNEFFDIGPEEPVPGPPIPGMEILAETNAWPAVEPVPGWREAMRGYYDHMSRVASAVMMSVGRSAGFADDDLMARFEGGNSTLRLLNYPAPPEGATVIDEMPDEAADAGSVPLAAGRHTDGAGVSLLWQRQPGLQAQAPDGTWRDVPRLDNCVSVHLGDVLEVMTGGRVPATPHRVIDHGTPRQSIGFFLEPALGAKLTALEARDSGPDAAESARGTYGWHLLRRLSGYAELKDIVPRPDEG